eukprot:TRINITY_DN2235_c0_g2_i1.p2 TRINITY_DN2235_c0_g2~~TRINITY_DN2235_c0_g2_i1.p2  ORF type:complete len:125 (-),score=28.37 TRINITY_DN2235_c0_g2_i1:333-707(-)
MEGDGNPVDEESSLADQPAKQAYTLQMLQDVLDEILLLVQQEPYLLEYAVPLAEEMLQKLKALQAQRQRDVQSSSLQDTMPDSVPVHESTKHSTKRPRHSNKRLKPTTKRVKRLKHTTKRLKPF